MDACRPSGSGSGGIPTDDRREQQVHRESDDFPAVIGHPTSQQVLVGYGDVLPTTTEATVLAMVLMLVGIGYFAVITGALAERFIERGREEHVEAVEAEAPDDLGAHVDRLALRARELVTELEALRLALAEASGGDREHT
jgi:hypothetical protein